MAVRRKKFIRGKKRAVREHRLNEEITEPKVRLVGEEEAEVILSSEALRRAVEKGVDLVEVAKGQDPPIVRIIDYGKFKFEKAKKDKESKKHQKVIQVKEVKMGPKIDIGDFERKCNLAQTFLDEGDNVKITMRFKGREMAHTELGLEKMQNVIKILAEVGAVDRQPKLEGRIMSMVLRPKGKKSGSDKPKPAKPEENSNPAPEK